MYILLGHHKCREQWPADTKDYERSFNILLDVILLILPLMLLASTYSLITKTLWKGMVVEKSSRRQTKINIKQFGEFCLVYYLLQQYCCSVRGGSKWLRFIFLLFFYYSFFISLSCRSLSDCVRLLYWDLYEICKNCFDFLRDKISEYCHKLSTSISYSTPLRIMQQTFSVFLFVFLISY